MPRALRQPQKRYFRALHPPQTSVHFNSEAIASEREPASAEVVEIRDHQKEKKADRGPRKSRISENWQPDDQDRQYAAFKGHDHEWVEETLSGSAITTSKQGPYAPVGARRGEPGSSATLTLPATIAANDPEAVDRAMVRILAPSVSSNLTERRRDCSTVEYGYETRFAGYDLAQGCDPVDVTAAIDVVEAKLRPCPAM